jgi:hypothetical protein
VRDEREDVVIGRRVSRDGASLVVEEGVEVPDKNATSAEASTGHLGRDATVYRCGLSPRDTVIVCGCVRVQYSE